ncbi:MAG: diguanylate cyclase [Pseudomonadota bacterium]
MLIICLPFIGLWVWWRGFAPARFFVLAWTIFCFGTAYFQYVLIRDGAADESMVLMFLACNVTEVLLLSFALADRINLLQRQKDEVEQRHRLFLSRAKDELEYQVELRTQELRQAKEFAEALASTDVLTQLNNRRAFFERSEPALKLADRYKQPLSLLFLDIDHFKKVNDTYGHAIGDEILKAVANTIRVTVRETDIAGRLGGEEFAVLLPNTLPTDAINLAERIRQAIAGLRISDQSQQLSVTTSFGVADHHTGGSLEKLLSYADVALYQAKSGGRNQVVRALVEI